MRLREIAFTRSGDKGDTVNVGVVPYDTRDWPYLLDQVTVERVASHFARTVSGAVRRYELPNLPALNFVMQGALDGGGSGSLHLDALGKTYQSHLLDLELDGVPPSRHPA